MPITLPFSRSWLFAAGIVLAVALWMLSGALQAPGQPVAAGSAATAENPIPRIRVVESIARPMTSRLQLTGRTVAARHVEVRAETAGVVAALGAARGSSVAEGALLVRLAVEDREARLLEAQSRVAEAATRYEAALRLDQQGFQAQTALAQAKAALDAAKAAVRMAELELARIAVTAPIPGVVNERHVEVGDFVDRGERLVNLVDLDPMRVVGQVSERYLGQIIEGVAGEARTLDGRRYAGTVSYVGRVADQATRTFPVELEIPNPEGRLIEGITAELSLPVEEVYAHRIAPSTLSLADSGALGIKAVDDDGRVSFHAIEVLGDSPEGIWVGGLPDRIRLITVGQAFVRPGQRVEIQRDGKADGRDAEQARSGIGG